MIPTWLHNLSIAYLLVGAVCAAGISSGGAIGVGPQRRGVASEVFLDRDQIGPSLSVISVAWVI